MRLGALAGCLNAPCKLGTARPSRIVCRCRRGGNRLPLCCRYEPVWGESMKMLVLALLLAAASPVRAQNIDAADAKAHVGQTVTVQGTVSAVHTIAGVGVTFIDMGERYPDVTFTAVILPGDAAKFPNAAALEGKDVAITGLVRLYQGKPDILLQDATQLTVK